MISIHSERPWSAGKVRRRYTVVLTDVNSVDHTEVVGPVTVDPNDTGASIEASVLSSKKQGEIDLYKSEIREGNNPFQLYGYTWNTRAELLKAVLDEALSQPATDPIVYNGLPYLSLVTDSELMAIYSKGQAWVDSVRAAASNLLSGKTVLDAYTPILVI